ncbi:dihydrodipicolinate synthase family protein [Streptomyces sp. SID13031]|uniref:dihydrodipicolinate synthase family protein n=1 Tax=Streptomyces sp. SID13031 TaxID=2706046 RepID=UPI0013C9335D|nr:dihydrodipicolinate synthase family protein [Streptomyces sp. SID13031]NEA31649.1 dihydrodipicolinate synthase family protein [Streptomyces sp. SID13031]
MHPLVDQLRGTLLPAVVTPMDSSGVVAYDALEAYASAIAAGSIGGVAVWAHTGRGLYLSEADRGKVMATWRAATRAPLVAGVGMPRSTPVSTLQEAEDATVAMAVNAAGFGADAVMVYPLAAYGSLPDGDAAAVRLHRRVAAESGLPLVGFYLHGGAGGYPYPPSLIQELLSLPEMLGVKTATLHDAVSCQDAIWAGRSTGKLLITGEDRMYGPSMMWGADTALVGIAAAQVELSAAVLRAWTTGAHAEFLSASERLDRFAAATFYDPIEGYIQRMLWAAVWEGLLPEEAAHDPYGPSLPSSERDLVIRCLESL